MSHSAVSTSSSSFPLAFPVIWGRRYGCRSSLSRKPCLLHRPLSVLQPCLHHEIKTTILSIKFRKRKGALNFLCILTSVYDLFQDLDAIYQRCLDPALSVRKQALVSLTALLQKMTHNAKLQGSVANEISFCWPQC